MLVSIRSSPVSTPPVQGATLLSLVDGREYDEIVADPAWSRLVSSPESQEAWVVSMPASFTSAIADASEGELRSIAEPWSKTEEFWGAASADDLMPMLLGLRELALSVRDTGAQLYCWISL
ncbi:hypothetical protein [Microbacterium stercoris]|uniref:Uncharacterized protein n=1 Tax=Microbacterium stercoris TaxID=2820289 RepID=A0A939QKK2_9MICO|nr:hypothetical protein [Microbacterium stercoris]MBO3663860.1 hypothetical protein [Microbacterium stercoris]